MFNCSHRQKRGLFTPSQLVPIESTIAVVGNGGSSHKNRTAIESADWIIRFNDYKTNADTGRRTDLHFVNGHPKCHVGVRLLIRAECAYPKKNMLGTCPHNVRECVPTSATRSLLCATDPSRGFMAVSMFRQHRLKLFGFVGQGHYYDESKKTHVWHSVEEEHRLLKTAGFVSNVRI